MRVVDAWHNKDRTRTARYGTGKRWIAMWSDRPGTPERKKSFEKKDQAQAWLDNIKKESLAGFVVATDVTPMNEWIDMWRSRQLHQKPGSQRVLDVVAGRLQTAFRGMFLESVERKHIQEIVAGWEAAGLAPATVQVTMAYLTLLFSEAVHDKKIRESPAIRISRRRVEAAPISPLTVGAVQAIVDAMHPWFGSMAIFVAATGLRQSEVAGLTVDRVDLERGSVLVDRQWVGGVEDGGWAAPKTPSSIRRIKIGPRTIRLLRPLVEGRLGGAFVWEHPNGGVQNGQRQSVEWARVRKRMPDLEMGRGWHQLRHHHASQLIAAGASPVAVASRLGHKDVSLTLRVYAHLWESDDDKLALLSDGLLTANHHETTTNPADPND